MTGLLLIMFFLSILPLTAFGAGGDGAGNTGGVFKPLGLTTATLEDGTSIINAENVPLKPKITLHFDKNVVHLSYWERNKRCFHLYNENEEELALKVTKIDDTVDFSKRQYIWVEPTEALFPGTNYMLYVAPDLLAKNGGSTLAMTTNNQGETIKFKTAGEKAGNTGKSTGPAVVSDNQSPEPKPVEPPTGDVPAQTNTESTLNQKNEISPARPAVPGREDTARFAAMQQGRRMQNYLAAAAGVVLVGWVAVEFFRRRKRGARGEKHDV